MCVFCSWWCHNTGSVVMRYCGFWTPFVFSLLMPPRQPCLLRHAALSRYSCTSAHFCSTLLLCAHQRHHFSVKAPTDVFLLETLQPCTFSLCVLSSEEGRVDQFTRLASVARLFQLCISSFKKSQRKRRQTFVIQPFSVTDIAP